MERGRFSGPFLFSVIRSRVPTSKEVGYDRPACIQFPASTGTGRCSTVHVAIDDCETLGSGDQVALSALAASDSSWIEFSEKWSDALGRHGLKFMHTTDFLTKNGPHKENSPISRDDRLKVLGDFTKIIRETVTFGFSVVVNKSEYISFMSGVDKKINAQSFCFHRIISKIVDHLNNGLIEERISFMVDDSAKQSQHFLSLWQSTRNKNKIIQDSFPSLSFCDDKVTFPLQGADVLANFIVHEIRRGEDAFSFESPLKPYSPIYGDGYFIHNSEWWKAEDFQNAEDYVKAVARGAWVISP